MVRAVFLVFGLMLAISLLSASPSQAQQWVLGNGFSLTSNESGCWRLGCIGGSGEFTPYNTTFSPCEGISGWALDSDPDKAGDVIKNTGETPNDSYNSDIRAGQICLHASQLGKRTAVRWVAPVLGDVKIDAAFSGQGFYTLADVQVIKNGRDSLKSFRISGFVGMGANQDQRTGESPDGEYSGVVRVNSGDTVDFTIGCVDKAQRPEGLADATGHVAIAVAIQVVESRRGG